MLDLRGAIGLLNPFGLVVVSDSGGVLNKVVSPNMPKEVIDEAVTLGRDLYRILETVASELGYEIPRTVTLKLDEYDLVLIRKKGKLVIAITYIAPAKGAEDYAMAEA